MEERKARGFDISSAGEDMISKLPDALISQMLLYLPTKEAVRTSVLSNRWKKLWLSIPGLDLDSSEFPDYNAFVGFVDRFLDFSREEESCLHRLKLSILRKDENDQLCVNRWIDFVATGKLERLDVECLCPVEREGFVVIPQTLLICLNLEVIPQSLYICETLLHLRLHRVSLDKLESVSLPRLKTMLLEYNVYASEAVLESLISSCPVLEDLSIVRRVFDNLMVLRVHSLTLTSLSISLGWNDDDLGVAVDDDEVDRKDSAVLIDAPRLEHLSFEDDTSAGQTIGNSGSLTKVTILGDFSMRCEAAHVGSRYIMTRNFLTNITVGKSMHISAKALEIFSPSLKVEPLSQFCNLSCLEVELQWSPDILQTVLESSPNLKSLILAFRVPSRWMKPFRVSSVPRCLLTSLETVEIRIGHPRYHPAVMEVASYFVEKSLVLKKLVLRSSSSTPEEDPVFLKELLSLCRGDLASVNSNM